MRTMALALAALQARACDVGTSGGGPTLTAMALALGQRPLSPFVGTTAVQVTLHRTLEAGRALDAARQDGSPPRSGGHAVFEASLYRLAMAASTARPDEAAMSALPDYDRTEVANPVTRPA